MTIEVEKEQPVAKAEKAIEDAAPAAVQPEVAALEAEFNTAVDTAAEKAPEAHDEAAKTDPAVADVAKDAAVVAGGGSVPVTTLVSDVGAVVKETKAGYKTTEFWLSGAIILLTQLGALDLPGKYGKTITTAAAAVGYAISRGLAK